MLHIPGAPLLRISCAPCITAVRGRKSRSDPSAKSKASRIKYPPMVCIEELLNIRRRNEDYTAILSAMRADFKEDMLRLRYEQQAGSYAERRLHMEAMEHAALMAWNMEENNKALRRRLERLKVEDKAVRVMRKEASKLKHEVEVKEQQERQLEIERLEELSRTFITPENLVERIEAALELSRTFITPENLVERIEAALELSRTFITPENLVERIEAALDSPKSYNFCLDQSGRILREGAGQS